MITITNYQEKKDSIDWKKMPANIVSSRSDIEDMLEFYNDDADIKDAIDLFLKAINENSKPTIKEVADNSDGKIQIVSVPKKNNSLAVYKAGLFLTKDTLTAGFSYTDNENLAYTWTESEREIARKIAKKHDGTVITIGNKANDLLSENNKKEQFPFINSKFKSTHDVYTGRYYSDVDLFYYSNKDGSISEIKTEAEFDKIKKDRSLVLKPKEIKEEKKEPISHEVRNVILYAKVNDQNVFKATGGGHQVENLLYATIYPIENMDKLIKSIPYSDTVHFQIRVAGGSKVLWDSKKDQTKKPTTKTTKVTKAKVAKVIVQKKIITITPEYLLIKRFWNIIKNEKIVIPFRTTQLLHMAFNKAAVERKVRKTSEAADLFAECQKKINVLFQEFAAPTQADVKVDFTDKKLYAQIQEYVTTSTVNPAVPVINRFIAMQNTLPDLKKAETLLKSLTKIIDNDKNNRLIQELNQARVALEKYIAKPKDTIEPKVYGLSVPAVCLNRVKCVGIDKSGKLLKGFKFEEHTGHVVRVRKTNSRLASPNVCENRVKCTGLSKSGKLLPGYKFEEGTNHVVKVRKPTAKKKTVKKKVAAGLGYSDNLKFEGIERIYIDQPVLPITLNTVAPSTQKAQYFTDNSQSEIQNETLSKPSIVKTATVKPKNKLMEMQFDSLDMDEGWEKFMQHPAKNMKVAIWGKPKNGKTAGSLQMADYLSKFGTVLYNFADQGFNKSTQDLWKMSGLANNTNAEPSDVSTLAGLEKEVATGKYSFVFIDMISDYINKENIKPYEFKERFMKKYPNVSFILIFEVTKGGDFKGDQGWTHIVDAIVTVEDFLMENRGRYGVGSHIVWKDGLKKFNPKKYAEVIEELQPESDLEFSEEVESI